MTKDPEKLKANRRRYYESHRAKFREYDRGRSTARYKKDPKAWLLRNFKANLKRLYGLTWEQYEKMAADARGLCGLCGLPEPLGTRLTVDHCHVTGKVRGLMCRQCNATMGMANDNPELLYKMATWLETR